MNMDSVREYCLSLPNATEGIQWDNDLLFRIGNKIFVVLCLDASSPNKLSFKCTPERYQELIEQQGIIPAPYMARNHWVALQRFDALDGAELKELIRGSYDMVFAKLPKKVRVQLDASA